MALLAAVPEYPNNVNRLLELKHPSIIIVVGLSLD